MEPVQQTGGFSRDVGLSCQWSFKTGCLAVMTNGLSRQVVHHASGLLKQVVGSWQQSF